MGYTVQYKSISLRLGQLGINPVGSGLVQAPAGAIFASIAVSCDSLEGPHFHTAYISGLWKVCWPLETTVSRYDFREKGFGRLLIRIFYIPTGTIWYERRHACRPIMFRTELEPTQNNINIIFILCNRKAFFKAFKKHTLGTIGPVLRAHDLDMFLASSESESEWLTCWCQQVNRPVTIIMMVTGLLTYSHDVTIETLRRDPGPSDRFQWVFPTSSEKLANLDSVASPWVCFTLFFFFSRLLILLIIYLLF